MFHASKKGDSFTSVNAGNVVLNAEIQKVIFMEHCSQIVGIQKTTFVWFIQQKLKEEKKRINPVDLMNFFEHQFLIYNRTIKDRF